jgi:hypothetical protein
MRLYCICNSISGIMNSAVRKSKICLHNHNTVQILRNIPLSPATWFKITSHQYKMAAGCSSLQDYAMS